MDACRICDALDEKNHASSRTYNKHLKETKTFVVLPALGALMPGHVMVVTKEHLLNFATLSADAKQEYESLISEIREMPFYASTNILEAEHGSSTNESGGACITHAHINIFPSYGAYLHKFDAELKVKYIECDYKRLSKSDAPYLYLRNNRFSCCFDAYGTTSQYIRKRLTSFEGRTNWDWKEDPRIDYVEQTITIWAD